ncbi:inorganic pyrophosphatase [Ochromonadaceae sp. CCMP2298]|nr:inorganic pyrophosphatase [Ochromonadaceae sp. CCMP2298]
MPRRLFLCLVAMLHARTLRAIPLLSQPRRQLLRSLSLLIGTTPSGEHGTASYRVNFLDKDGNGSRPISPWHDIPLRDGEYFNFITEIPKYTRAKYEVNTSEEGNPIAQDVKKGQLRDYHGPIFWNYGCLPQTWEDPNVLHPEVGCKGDNDPLDVVEIGSQVLATGSVSRVKVLGALAMIDDGELDWKVLVIRVDDALAAELHDVADVEVKCPGTVSGIREWFRWYKSPDLKPLNRFGFNERCLSRAETLEVVEETHQYWKDLKEGKTERGKHWIP